LQDSFHIGWEEMLVLGSFWSGEANGLGPTELRNGLNQGRFPAESMKMSQEIVREPRRTEIFGKSLLRNDFPMVDDALNLILFPT
jgi:hypothetical protein